MEFKIERQWNGQPSGHRPISLVLSPGGDDLKIDISAPFFNDPPSPGGPPGKPFQQLWDYEVVEAFFLGKDNKYLELEFCPHGQHLILLLNGCRKMVKDMLPLETYTSHIDGSVWTGSAVIPKTYFPPKVVRWNAYAIHGSGEKRMYEALFPVLDEKFKDPDFHRLDYFKDIDVSQLLPGNKTDALSEVWTSALAS